MGESMDWLRFTNAFTALPVHVRAGMIVAIYQDTTGTIIELQGGGQVPLRETVDEVKKALDTRPAATAGKKKEIETR